MIKHFKYLKYVLRHKWYVGIACFKEGVIIRGILHDWHKFLPSEWSPYVNRFYGDKTDEQAFDLAWLYHRKRADHHWQWWASAHKTYPMSDGALKEMLCDWYGMTMTVGSKDGWEGTKRWYEENKENMNLHESTTKDIRWFFCQKGHL